MMHNRWFHRPRLHSPAPGNTRRVEWLELFYDLIYVAAIIQLGNGLSNNPGLTGTLIFAGLFVPVWSAWTSFTFLSNRFIVDDFVHRLMVFGQMFAIGAMAVNVGGVWQGEPDGFALCYAIVRLFLVAMYTRMWRHGEGGAALARRNAIGFAVGASLWTISVFVPQPWSYLLWGAALMVDFAVPLNRRSRQVSLRHPPDVLHMAERYGLLTIIVLGESFVKVLSQGAADGWSADFALMGALALLITFSLWWLYFDDVAGSRIRPGELTPFVWVYSHLPLTLGVTAVGVAIKKAALMDPMAPGYGKYRWLLCGTLAVVLLSVAVLDKITERRVSDVDDRHRIIARVASAVAVLLLAAVGDFMTAALFVGLVTVICVAQVIIDLLMAPMADPHEAHHESPLLFGGAFSGDEEAAEENAQQGLRRVRDTSQFVRKGTPSELRSDLYFHLMEGTWRRLFVIVLTAYIFINLIFGALYLLDDADGIAGLVNLGPDGEPLPRRFADAFFFSVQTLSTIGYGAMSPMSDYANTLVTIQAVVGVAFTALTTGLVFAKAARPRASALFSRVLTIRQYDGKPTLIFRVGNARGNEVVEATMRLVAVTEEVSSDGTKMRRLRDLKLVRDNSPLFVLSWTVMHVIDEDSPLWGCDMESLEKTLVTLSASMIGFDPTYAQNVHARHLFHPEDIRWGHRFVDVLDTEHAHGLLIDYGKFHDTRSDPDVWPDLPYLEKPAFSRFVPGQQGPVSEEDADQHADDGGALDGASDSGRESVEDEEP